MVSFPQVSPLITCMHVSCLPCLPHIQPISFFLIWLRCSNLNKFCEQQTHRNVSILRKQNIMRERTVWDMHPFLQLTQRLRFPRMWRSIIWYMVTILLRNTHILHLLPKDALGKVRKHIFDQAVLHSRSPEPWTQYLGTQRYTEVHRPTRLKKNNWKVAIFRPTRRSFLPRRPGWTDNLLNFFLVACKS